MDVVDVPAKLAARVRLPSTGHGRKNDDADAVSVGIAALSARTLTSAAVESTVTALRAIVEHRDDLVKTRTQTINRLRVVLTNLIPAGARRDLTAERPAELLRGIRPRDTAGKTLRGLAVDIVTEIRQLTAVTAKAAADTLGRIGTLDRFRSAAAFASYTGTAPIETSSGDVVRHRLSRAGNGQLNLCLHVMALTQIRQDTPGRAYYLRKRTEGKGHKEAMRCLKRRLSDVVYRQLLRDTTRLGAGPGGHSGAALSSSAAS